MPPVSFEGLLCRGSRQNDPLQPLIAQNKNSPTKTANVLTQFSDGISDAQTYRNNWDGMSSSTVPFNEAEGYWYDLGPKAPDGKNLAPLSDQYR